MKRLTVLGIFAGAALLSAGAAQAADVHWSIGISLPPIGTVISGPVYGAPVYYPAPVYAPRVYAPPPVYAPPAVVYPSFPVYAPPVVYAPPLVYRAPPVVYRTPPWGYAPRVVYERGHRHEGWREGRRH